jgi:multicomponent Na+:H+ antiporter subunit A
MGKTGNQTGKTFNLLGLWTAIPPAGLTVYLVTLVPKMMRGENLLTEWPWVPSLGVELSLKVDGLSVLFGLIITLVGSLVLLYAGGYLSNHPLLRRFYLYMYLFMASMLGVVFSNNLITLFVFWELTSLSSYLLIGFYHEKPASRRAALQALLVTGAGGLILLAGFLVLGIAAGSFDIGLLLTQSEMIQTHPLYGVVVVLVLVGAFTKSAQFPFHFWLPNAMEAPAPVSAYLHSATMVKAGIFLLARMTPVLGGTPLWSGILLPVGGITMLLAAWMALGQTDLKRILAYSTVSVLGMLTFLLGLGSSLAIKASMVLLVAHALYKGALFLSAGSVDHETGSRDILQLGGLVRFMPVTALTIGLATLSQSGIPPLFGFISKELLYEATLEAPQYALLTGTALLTSIFLVAVAGLVSLGPFTGKLIDPPKAPHEAPWSMLTGPIVLSVLGLLFGLTPKTAGSALIAPAAAAVMGQTVEVKLALWHGITPMLILSGITILFGMLLYALRDPIRNAAVKADFGSIIGPSRLYTLSLSGLEKFSQVQTRFLQNGSLPRYLLTVLLAAIGLIGYTLLKDVALRGILSWPEGMRFYEWVIPIVIVAATLSAVRSRSRLAAVAALGVVGFGVAMIYILFGAPDLAMTQFAIETLTVIIFVLVLYRLPRFAQYTQRVTRIRDAFIAITAGVMMSLLVLVVTANPLVSRLTPYFAENSYLLAKGRNIVNVILVDFRGIDTLGEITVLAVAAIGVFALMKLRPEQK